MPITTTYLGFLNEMNTRVAANDSDTPCVRMEAIWVLYFEPLELPPWQIVRFIWLHRCRWLPSHSEDVVTLGRLAVFEAMAFSSMLILAFGFQNWIWANRVRHSILKKSQCEWFENGFERFLSKYSFLF